MPHAVYDTLRRFLFTKNVRFLGSAAMGILCAWLFGMSSLGRFTELSAYDLRLKYSRHHRMADTSIVILTIDQNSLQYFKKRRTSWPWPRDFYALTTKYVMEGGARALVYDFHFNEHDEDRASSVGADNDRQFAEAIREGERVYLGAQLTVAEGEDQEGDTLIPVPRFVPLETAAQYRYDKTYAPLREFQEASAGVGVVNIFPDEDGICRQMPLVYDYLGRPFYTLSFEVYKTVHSGAMPALRSPFLLYYYGKGGPDGVFTYYSIHAVIVSALKESQGALPDVPKDVFRDKIVFVGANAPGLLDLRATPFTSEEPYPGVEIHATALSNFLRGDIVRTAPTEAVWAVAFVLTLLIGFIAAHDLKVWTVSAAAAVMLLMLWFVSFELFARALYLLPLVFPMATVVMTFVISLGWSYATEGRAKRQMQKMFGRYVNPHIVEQLAASHDDAGVSGVEVEATVLFSDIEGFTSISETKTPKELVAFLNDYFAGATKIYLKYDGTIDKFIGDAVMVLFGAPVRSEDHALQACRGAYEFHRTIERIAREAREKGEPVFFTRIGVNTGRMIVGSIGSSLRMEYTAIGDTVNLASRLEGVNKFYGTSLMISEFTAATAAREFLLRELDLIRVKGKKEPIKIFEIVCTLAEAAPETVAAVDTFRKALSCYRRRQWDEAIALFTAASDMLAGDAACAVYDGRCRDFMAAPPPHDWDGVYTMKAK